MAEEKVLSKVAIVGLVALTAIIELMMSYVLLILNALPAIMRGYLWFFYVPVIAWMFLTILWCYGMYLFISKRRRRRMLKSLKSEW